MIKSVWPWLFGVASYILGLFSHKVLLTFLNEKAKNLATKQDISDITAREESVKSTFARAADANKIFVDEEARALSETWAKAIALKSAYMTLYPIGSECAQILAPKGVLTARHDNENYTAALPVFSSALDDLERCVQDKSPYCERDLIAAYEEIFLTSRSEHPSAHSPLIPRTWELGEARVKSVVTTLDRISELMRSRIAFLRRGIPTS